MTTPQVPECPSGTAEVARQLTEALDRMSGRLKDVQEDSETRDKELAQYGRRNRHLIAGLIVSLALDLALTVVVAVFAVQAHNASTLATEVHAGNIAACQAGNIARAEQVQLWDHLLSVAQVPPHESAAAQRKRLATVTAFRMYVHTIFAPHNCEALYGKGRS